MSIADRGGFETLTMRSVAKALGVAPMALYRHVANKEDLVDGMVDAVFAEVTLPERSTDWRGEMLRRTRSMREVLARHPWAIALMESRAKGGPATLRHHDAVIASLRRGGLSLEQTAHAYSLIDSYVYGFALEEANLPFRPGDDVGKMATEILAQFPKDTYPNLAAFTFGHVMQPGYDYGAEFEYGIGLLLDGLERVRATGERPVTRR